MNHSDVVVESINNQLEEEIGDQEKDDFSAQEWSMLLQKYGLVEPKLTVSEKNLILKEQRIYAKQGF